MYESHNGKRTEKIMRVEVQKMIRGPVDKERILNSEDWRKNRARGQEVMTIGGPGERKSGVKGTEYTECQAFVHCPVVRIGSPHPSPVNECCLPPLGPRGETHTLAGEGRGGGPNSDERMNTLVFYVYYCRGPNIVYVCSSRNNMIILWREFNCV